MAFSAIFYFCFGMLFFLRILRLLKLTYIQQSFTIILVTLGSNIIYYTIDTPVWSHIYSFTIVSAFVYYVMKIKDNPEKNLIAKNLILISLLSGLIFIIRPVNIMIILLMPFLLWKDRSIVLKYFTEKPLRIIYLLSGMIWIIIMLTMYKISTGNYFLYSYKSEGFNFIHPHLWQFLFHYDDGIFPYTPLYFMPFLFLFAWYRKENRDLMIGCISILLMVIYINSSWWFWSFGLSFGSRTMLDFLPLFGIPLALSIKQATRDAYFYIIPIYLLCCGLTMILYNQKSAHGFMNQLSAHITDYWPAIFDALKIKL